MALVSCLECNKEISESAPACPNCGAPKNGFPQQSGTEYNKVRFANNKDTYYKEKRHVGFLLGLGILFFPIIFVWFLLRKGHSTIARIIGFSYFFVGILFSILVFMAAVSAANTSSTKQSFSSASRKSTSNENQNIPLELNRFSSAEIERAYEANTVSADQQFKGKRFIVTGNVADINTDFSNNPYVVMSSSRYIGARAYFKDGQENEIAKLAKGNQVVLDCVGGGDIAKTPTLRNCTLTK